MSVIYEKWREKYLRNLKSYFERLGEESPWIKPGLDWEITHHERSSMLFYYFLKLGSENRINIYPELKEMNEL